MKQDIEKISAGLTRLLDEVEGVLQATVNGAGETTDLAKAKGREALHRIRGQLREARDELGARARRVDGAVHAHPWEAIAPGAIAGFVAGLLVRRR